MMIEDAQRDIRRAYIGGGPGAIISGLIWMVTALVEPRVGVATAFAILFFGGMLIFPLSAIVQLLAGRGKVAAGNTLGRVALESTIAMIACLVAAWLLVPSRPGLVFPVAAVAVGTRYFAFRSVYGDMTYWLLGGALTGVGALGIFTGLLPESGVIWAVAVIEVAFGIVLTLRNRREPVVARASGG